MSGEKTAATEIGDHWRNRSKEPHGRSARQAPESRLLVPKFTLMPIARWVAKQVKKPAAKEKWMTKSQSQDISTSIFIIHHSR